MLLCCHASMTLLFLARGSAVRSLALSNIQVEAPAKGPGKAISGGSLCKGCSLAALEAEGLTSGLQDSQNSNDNIFLQELS